jgi:hypothetical protein
MQVAAPLLALSLAGALASCSLVAINRAPSGDALRSAGAEVNCTDGLTYPLVDMAGTVLGGVLAVSLLSSDNKDDLKIATYGSAGVSIGLAASAIYGMFQVSRCREAKRGFGDDLQDAVPEEDREPPGTHGGACKDDADCEDDLYCDQPMQVCVPLNEPGGSL